MQFMEEAAGVAANRYFASGGKDNSTAHPQQRRIAALLSRVERLSFQHAIHVGDVAQVHAKVVFASEHSVAVCVQVRAERMAWSMACGKDDENNGNNDEDNNTTISNRALMWWVGAILPCHTTTTTSTALSMASVWASHNPKNYTRAKAPPFPVPSAEKDEPAWAIYQQAAQLYQQSKEECDQIRDVGEQDPSNSRAPPLTNVVVDKIPRQENNPRLDDTTSLSSSLVVQPSLTGQQQDGGSTSRRNPHDNMDMDNDNLLLLQQTPDHSAVELAQVMLPSDCMNATGLVAGGVLLKLMDNACGIVAVRHCGTNTVTVSVNCVNFVSPVLLGDVVKIRARPVFTSGKSIEIRVQVLVERFSWKAAGGGNLQRHEIVTTEQAYFTFVALPFVEEGNSNHSPISSLPMRQLLVETPDDKVMFEQRRLRYQQRKRRPPPPPPPQIITSKL